MQIEAGLPVKVLPEKIVPYTKKKMPQVRGILL
jgi:hypothetical protein